jgi:serine phosphatase RsbU (regulator of sigma subunit)
MPRKWTILSSNFNVFIFFINYLEPFEIHNVESSMSHYYRQILKNASTRVLVIIFLCLIFLTAFFLINNYNSLISNYEKGELRRLESIARSLAVQIDANKHRALDLKYPEKDGITKNEDDLYYEKLHYQLLFTKTRNELKTDIYTMSYDPEDQVFKFIGTSGSTPYFKHKWNEYKQVHIDKYEEGATIRPYEDNNGIWLSAFAPIRNNYGMVPGIVQVDEEFATFISTARKIALKQVFIALAVFVVVAVFLFQSIRRILLQEEKLKMEIINQSRLIEIKNKDIMDSIHYAEKIQQAILPNRKMLQQFFKDSFVYFSPKDFVSGDFYWFSENENFYYVAAADCTGHGVPGAFMSMIGNTILNDVVNHLGIQDPGSILDALDSRIKSAFSPSDGESIQNRDGMDIGLCAIEKKSKFMNFAGAYRPLYLLREGNLEEIKGTKQPIGGGNIKNDAFVTEKFQLKDNDALYIFSDGYPDQFGGPKGKKFKIKKFKELLLNIHIKSMDEQYEIVKNQFESWKKDFEQIDDVLVLGFKI